MRKILSLFPMLFLLASFSSGADRGAEAKGWKDGEAGHKLGCALIQWLGYDACGLEASKNKNKDKGKG